MEKKCLIRPLFLGPSVRLSPQKKEEKEEEEEGKWGKKSESSDGLNGVGRKREGEGEGEKSLIDWFSPSPPIPPNQ